MRRVYNIDYDIVKNKVMEYINVPSQQQTKENPLGYWTQGKIQFTPAFHYIYLNQSLYIVQIFIIKRITS
jgi:hypothetical protein